MNTEAALLNAHDDLIRAWLVLTQIAEGSVKRTPEEIKHIAEQLRDRAMLTLVAAD